MFKKLILITSLSFVPLVANAEGPRDDTEHLQGKRAGHHGKKRMKHMLRMLKKIGVDDATLGKIKTKLAGQKPQMKALRERMKTARRSGDPILKTEARLAMMTKRLETLYDIKAFLSDAQWQALSREMQKKQEHRRHKGR